MRRSLTLDVMRFKLAALTLEMDRIKVRFASGKPTQERLDEMVQDVSRLAKKATVAALQADS